MDEQLSSAEDLCVSRERSQQLSPSLANQDQNLRRFKVLTEAEARTLYYMCEIILDDPRRFVIADIVSQFDRTLNAQATQPGVDKTTVKQGTLIRSGLSTLNQYCQSTFGVRFEELTEKNAKCVLDSLSGEEIRFDKSNGCAVDFFNEVFTEALSAYYRHPAVWASPGYTTGLSRAYERLHKSLWKTKEAAPLNPSYDGL